jgi:hypothetical protein
MLSLALAALCFYYWDEIPGIAATPAVVLLRCIVSFR